MDSIIVVKVIINILILIVVSNCSRCEAEKQKEKDANNKQWQESFQQRCDDVICYYDCDISAITHDLFVKSAEDRTKTQMITTDGEK